jgi:hypothetical protein
MHGPPPALLVLACIPPGLVWRGTFCSVYTANTHPLLSIFLRADKYEEPKKVVVIKKEEEKKHRE